MYERKDIPSMDPRYEKPLEHRKIRALLVGCGKMGRNHLRVLQEHPRFEVVGIVDPLRGESGFEHYRHLNTSIPRPDVAIVATPPETHMSLASQLAGRSIPTLIEKPIATEEAGLAIAPSWWRWLVVGHIERFNPAVQALRECLAHIGEVHRVVATRIGSPPPETGREIGCTLDLAIHDIDVCRFLFGPMRVDSADCNRDACAIRLLSHNGIDVEVRAGWGDGEKVRTLVVEGERGTLALNYTNQTIDADGETIAVKKSEPLRAELDALGDFVATGKRGDLCSPEDAFAAVTLARHAMDRHGFV